ncbi:MAG: RICIN domain-containing protein [Clostridia bacterium]|nr:RICIN domain-containing protein [Clostridia bacterium]
MKENKKESIAIAKNAKQMHSNMIRTLSLIMTIIMICPLISSAVSITDKETIKDYLIREEISYEYNTQAGDMTLEELKSAKLKSADIPAEISEEICTEREHVNRLYEQEPDANTVMFQNRDGSKTVYYFSKPVKEPEENNNNSGGTEATDASVAAFFIKDKKVTITRANNVLARLCKTNADSKIYDYNIGHADIQYLKTKITGKGLDITKELREASNNIIITEGEELMIDVNEEGIGSEIPAEAENENDAAFAVISITYSPIAGIITLKNKSTAQYLRNNNGTPATGSFSAAYGRWILNYIGSGRYYIKSLTTTGNYKYLTANSAVTSVSLTNTNTQNSIWYFETLEIGGQTFYYIRSRNASGKALNSSLGFTTVSNGSIKNEGLWQIMNRQETAVSIEYPETGLLKSGEPLESLLTIAPSNAATNISWFNVNNIVNTETNEYGEPTITESGIYELWFEDRYSGLGLTDTGEEEPVNILVPEEPGAFNLGRTFMIRPYSDTSKYLTLTNTSTSANTTQINNISVEGLAGGATGSNPAYTAKWTNKSQIFTLDTGSNGALRITATLCSEQYRGVPSYSGTYDSQDCSSYTMTHQSDVTNTLYVSGTTLSGRKLINGPPSGTESSSGCVTNTDTGLNWYLIDAGSTLFNASSASEATVHFYLIVNATGSGSTQSVKALKNTSTGSGASVSVLGDSTSRVIANLWYVNEIGINIPLIKQMRTTYCGYTTLLQIMYGAGTAQNLTSSTSLWDQTMVVGDSSHACGIGPGAKMDQGKICERLNGATHFMDGSFDKINCCYKCNLDYNQSISTDMRTNTLEKFIAITRSSLAIGWGCFFLTEAVGGPYCYGDGGCHYSLISGYDSISNSFITVNCHYLNNNYGIYCVSANELYSNINVVFWAEER